MRVTINREILPGFAVAGLMTFATVTGVVVMHAHEESVTRAHEIERGNAIMVSNHASYSQMVFDGHLADTLSAALAIEEDDARWDCTTMGNHMCGNVITLESDREVR